MTTPDSPSERYAAWAAQKRLDASELGRFTARFPFDLDPFQLEGCRELEADRSVLVAAPTGAGKTVVGEFAVHLALAQGRKVFYTAPIKALSNQKHGELVDWLGAERVGLLTGDTSVRPDADVVVMTTEVLRNMLYADSPLLEGLGFVVMDEVHYLADRLRGPVWEEVIILRDRLERRGVRRLAAGGPRGHRRRRLRDPPGAAVAARRGGGRAARPLRRRRR